MDEERKLVIELQSKLAELNQKVSQYRRDMVAEFEKYAEGVLKDVPKDMSETVSKAIAISMKDYKSLYQTPGTEDASESGSAKGTSPGTSNEPNDINNESSPRLYSFPKPITYRRSSSLQVDDDFQQSRSPHEREKEFQGLFTPSYLPLLGDNRNERRASNERRTSYELPLVPLDLPRRTETSVDASTDTRSLTATPDLVRPPVPKRKNTDEVSVASDASEGTLPRSALRRSSSASMKPSPRRVRFDVEGVEVLPTSSPLPASNVGPEGQYNSDDEVGSQQVEDIEEEDPSPPPKRISSSQALRALSRKPLEDDTTTWTAVSAPDDGSPSVPTTARASDDSLSDLNKGAGEQRLLGSDGSQVETEESSSQSSQSKVENGGKPVKVDEQTEQPSDDEMLDMPQLKPMKGRKILPPASILSPINPVTIEGNHALTSPTRAPRSSWKSMNSLGDERLENIGQGLRFGEDDPEELFDFDENTTQQRSPPEAPQEDSEDSDDSNDTELVTSPTERNTLGLSDYSRSPARLIQRPIFQQPSQPTGSLVSSFKNHPFSMPIVSDAMHAQAASMGPVNSFVGSMTGRSGFDESNVASYRATGGMGSFTGEPKSMTERMMMEDFEEAEAAKKNKN